VRVPDGAGLRAPQLAEFQTTVRGLLALRDWLAAYRVTHVEMEATGVYWQPVWQLLEDDFKAHLHAQSSAGGGTTGLRANRPRRAAS
jgi:hypothetical protein